MKPKKVFKPVTPERMIALSALVIASLTLVGFITAVIAFTSSGSATSSNLQIEDIFTIQGDNAASNKATYILEIYLTNNGNGVAKETKITAYAENDRKIVIAKGDGYIGDIQPKKTATTTISLLLIKNISYAVSLRVWSGELVVLKGPGTIDLRSSQSGGGSSGGSSGGSGNGASSGSAGFDPSKIQPVETPKYALGGGGAGSADMAAGFMILLPLGGLFLILLLLWGFRKMRKNKLAENIQQLSSMEGGKVQ